MTKEWDGTLKWLAEEAPQDFVDWLRQGSCFLAEVSPHLGYRTIDADLLYRALYQNSPYLLHIEFQKRSQKNMSRRMFEYSMLAMHKYKLPVYSVVIYLKKDRPIIKPPYIRALPWGEEFVRFNYRAIKLWEIPAETIFRSGREGLLPLIPLTKGGLRHEAIERVVERLNPVDGELKRDALSLTYALAYLQYTEVDDLLWLKRSFAMIDEIIEEMIKDSYVYKQLAQKEIKQRAEQAAEQGMKKGVEQGMKQGVQQGVQQALVSVVQARFASLLPLVKERSALLKTPELLQQLLVQIVQAQNEDEARRFLLAVVDR